MPTARQQSSNEVLNGLGAKIRAIQSFREQATAYPAVRALAETLSMGRALGMSSPNALFGNLRAVVRYVRDPVGTEFIKAPWLMAREISARGWTAGDCDDMASLAYTLLNTLGFNALLAVGWYGSQPLPSHIWARYQTKAGPMEDFDLCAPYLGMTKPGATQVRTFA